MDLAELAELVAWSPAQLRVQIGRACVEADGRPSEALSAQEDEPFLEWLANLTQLVDELPEKRGVIQRMAQLYFHAGSDVAVARVALQKSPFDGNPFTGIDIIRIGCVHEGFCIALRTLDVGAAAQLLRADMNNPFFEATNPGHLTVNIQAVLDGAKGPRVAACLKKHLDLCAGCAENYEKEQLAPVGALES